MQRSRHFGSAITFGALCVTLANASTAVAVETVTYTYDVHGRLVKVKHQGTVNDNLEVNYSYDSADNRTNVTVTGSPNTP